MEIVMTGGDDATRSTGTEAVMIYTTFPNETKAAEVAEAVVAGGLAACANILPGAHSIYLWQGKLQREQEAVAIMKTSRACSAAAIACIRQHHPYDTPAIVVFQIDSGSPDYLTWIAEQTKGASSSRTASGAP